MRMAYSSILVRLAANWSRSSYTTCRTVTAMRMRAWGKYVASISRMGAATTMLLRTIAEMAWRNTAPRTSIHSLTCLQTTAISRSSSSLSPTLSLILPQTLATHDAQIRRPCQRIRRAFATLSSSSHAYPTQPFTSTARMVGGSGGQTTPASLQTLSLDFKFLISFEALPPTLQITSLLASGAQFQPESQLLLFALRLVQGRTIRAARRTHATCKGSTTQLYTSTITLPSSMKSCQLPWQASAPSLSSIQAAMGYRMRALHAQIGATYAALASVTFQRLLTCLTPAWTHSCGSKRQASPMAVLRPSQRAADVRGMMRCVGASTVWVPELMSPLRLRQVTGSRIRFSSLQRTPTRRFPTLVPHRLLHRPLHPRVHLLATLQSLPRGSLSRQTLSRSPLVRQCAGPQVLGTLSSRQLQLAAARQYKVQALVPQPPGQQCNTHLSRLARTSTSAGPTVRSE
mmetsp:Transcript_5999/g.15285  ORF Transcript_5999/g.15285 Transcript_5999/m.15285 type:complete len:458 (+) Transcript_5999:4802-6175(+)